MCGGLNHLEPSGCCTPQALTLDPGRGSTVRQEGPSFPSAEAQAPGAQPTSRQCPSGHHPRLPRSEEAGQRWCAASCLGLPPEAANADPVCRQARWHPPGAKSPASNAQGASPAVGRTHTGLCVGRATRGGACGEVGTPSCHPGSAHPEKQHSARPECSHELQV